MSLLKRHEDGWLFWTLVINEHARVYIDLGTWGLSVSAGIRRPRYLAIAIGPLYIDITEISWL